jgi:hypothetical protein
MRPASTLRDETFDEQRLKNLPTLSLVIGCLLFVARGGLNPNNSIPC